jgi:hypothetical protein
MSLYNDGYSNRAVFMGAALADDTAQAVFTQSATHNFVATDTIQIGNQTYTFVSAIGSTPGNVLVGANFLASMTNLINAIGASGGGAATANYIPFAAASNVVGELNGANAAEFSALTPGAAGGDYPSVYTASGTSAGAFGGATFVSATQGVSRAIDWTIANGLSLQFEVTAPIEVPAIFAVYGDTRSTSNPCNPSGIADNQVELADSDLCNSAFGPADPMIVTIPTTATVQGTNIQGFLATTQISPVGSFYVGRPRCFGDLPFVFVKAIGGDTKNINITALLSRLKYAN